MQKNCTNFVGGIKDRWYRDWIAYPNEGNSDGKIATNGNSDSSGKEHLKGYGDKSNEDTNRNALSY
uniref:Uncharacterized protein n=1 Tax=Candidatus Kentrum sp. LFY TaxID=2126342 RepID=A0A450UJX1_9GAMM|nr:MAG: hypothetical protein BECKLFY1418B_GA0070995_103915 [Candidatus Kentron sp. LFY]VFJ94364.1 MAG: hypothetical protein BECKLFY1418A_GA0070994_103916 [Candidatus Kentron sp. LFY]VFK18559.1 MAG: hypothetical protein BECKLFY1418C_GA0070996_104516 [Candidatus Kentron sp. LFY]